MRKKPEPEVKPTEIGPPKAAIAGVVGIAAALVLGLLRRLRNAGKSGGGGRDNEWKTLAADATEKLAGAGFDIVAPLKLRWYNEIAPDSAKIAPGGAMGDDALVILVGNSKVLWPLFKDAHNSRPEIGDAAHPVDTYVDIEVNRAFRGKIRRQFYAHETKPGRLVAVQRMANVAGVAHLDERSHMSIHPHLGPWLAFRAVVVLDDTRGPSDAQAPKVPPNPLDSDPAARRRVDEAFDAALAGYETSGGQRDGPVAAVGEGEGRGGAGPPGEVPGGPGHVPLQLPGRGGEGEDSVTGVRAGGGGVNSVSRLVVQHLSALYAIIHLCDSCGLACVSPHQSTGLNPKIFSSMSCWLLCSNTSRLRFFVSDTGVVHTPALSSSMNGSN